MPRNPFQVIAIASLLLLGTAPAVNARAGIHYGNNIAAGHTFAHDGLRLYYEVYGTGEPLLLIHGNGASISSMAGQIEYFRKRYRVIAMDSRDHGRSSDSAGALTFELMTDDLAALLDHLHAGPAFVLGWSDGGIEALLLAIRHPDKVRKLAAMGANLQPGETALYPEAIALSESVLTSSLTAPQRASAQGKRALKVTQLDLDEPHIAPEALQAISAPTLVLAGDHDMIRDEHTVLIYHHLPNAQLAIFPNATHMIPIDDSALFNATVARFFTTPFVRKDRIKDFLASYEKFKAGEGHN